MTVTTPAGTSPADQYTYTYPFTGFAAPVDNPPTENMVTAGQSIPIKFSLGGNFGLGILAVGYPTAQQVSCASGAPVNTSTETDTAGSSGLQYDATTNTNTYVWKTSKASLRWCPASSGRAPGTRPAAPPAPRRGRWRRRGRMGHGRRHGRGPARGTVRIAWVATSR